MLKLILKREMRRKDRERRGESEMKVEGEVEIVQIVSGRVTLTDKKREDKKMLGR